MIHGYAPCACNHAWTSDNFHAVMLSDSFTGVGNVPCLIHFHIVLSDTPIIPLLGCCAEMRRVLPFLSVYVRSLRCGLLARSAMRTRASAWFNVMVSPIYVFPLQGVQW